MKRVLDLVLVLVVGVLQVGGAFVDQHNPWRLYDVRPIDGLALCLLVAGPLLLLARRRHPTDVDALTLIAAVCYSGLGYPGSSIFLSPAVAVFAAIRYGRRLATWIVTLCGYALLVGLSYLPFGDEPIGLRRALGLLAWFLVVLTIAEVARMRRERRAGELRAAAEEARRLAGEERLRIARELHDVLAHNISLINVQASTALHLMDERPEQARTALTVIKQSSRDVLTEMRTVLGVLREGAPRAPTSGLDRLDELLAATGATKTVTGTVRPVPAGIDLAAYRIIQEALTNARRHAGTADVAVSLGYSDQELRVEVENGPGDTAPRTPGTGNGIPGMRERATALGGTLGAEPTSQGGFLVVARLPLGGTP
ncbi:sensor histidine kinase [Rhizohabitans arisaemae]|uniref:sensor histidine kinase n=1 Tax=Rhizohabitans arisaemae TaxID=2720610 RepID=UPI0024B21E53|nr:sensor histidine kinase [Rhizohabitans arisaemae]